jgi:Flp pilus assembly protein TadG
MRTRHTTHRRRAGAALAEAAIVLPLVILFFLGILEYGRYLMMLHLLNNAAGAEYAAVHTTPVVLDGTTYGNATSDVTTKVTDNLGGQQLSGQAISVYLSDSVGNNQGTWTNAQAGQYICVQIAGTYRFAVPSLLGLPASMALSAKSVKRSEGN